MKDNQLIYIAFGDETYQTEAFFSIASAIARNLDTPEFAFDINVYTDNPEFYKNLPVQVHPINKDWYGEINYHFRLKPAVVYENADKYKKTILIDTDTFFKKSPKYLFDKITEKNLLCNSKHPGIENSLDTKVKEVISRENLLKENFIYLNSGVIGIYKDSKHILKKTIKIIDKLYPELSFYYTLEELSLALSVSLENIETVDCIEDIHHYWSRKAIFRKKAETWYIKHKGTPISNHALSDTLKVTDKIPKPPVFARLINKTLALSVQKKYRHFLIELFNATHNYDNEFDKAASTVWIVKSVENLKERSPNTSEEEINKLLNRWYIKLKTKNQKLYIINILAELSSKQ